MNEAKEWARQLNTLDRDDAWRLLQVHARCRFGSRLERVRWRETADRVRKRAIGCASGQDRAPLAPASFVQHSVRMLAGLLSCSDIGRMRADPGRNNRGIACRRAGARSAAAVWMEPLFAARRGGGEQKVSAFRRIRQNPQRIRSLSPAPWQAVQENTYTLPF
jgi:hypothetical protein